MEIEALRALYTQYQRRVTADPSGEIVHAEHTIRLLWHEHRKGIILYSDLNATNADRLIQQEITYFSDLGYDFEWKLFDYDQPVDLAERLRSHHFVQQEVEAVMVLPLQIAPLQLQSPVTYDIRKATTQAMFADADRVNLAVWAGQMLDEVGPDDISAWFFPRYEQRPETISLYVAYVDGEPVSYGRIEFTPDNPFASIWGGSTLPDYRRRGIYSQLVAKRLQEALARGCEFLTVDARPDTSMPILQKLGFVRIATATAFNWRA